ncbi:hypothetical protein [Thaumasiovibrio subtropicus]|uniref:hypothetical protein n=1 Tax=Thaumasiovibrio subtropicus TaxID=1891207 RepID=UPI000B35198A|nr:hypothetical protein [Thaumasiovibrio subtropicus]
MQNTKLSSLPTEQEIENLNESFKDIETQIAISMSYVRRVNQISFADLKMRFSGIRSETLQKYLQPSYESTRPLHVVAAYSWAMMVPMTALYHGMKLREYYRGMDEQSIEGLIRIGKLPEQAFNAVLEIILTLLDEQDRQAFIALRDELNATTINMSYDEILPPRKIDLECFAEDYYRSLAINMRQFRHNHEISVDMMSRVLGLSVYQYKMLENERKTMPVSVSVGFRGKLGFKLNSHASFTSEMRVYPQFHLLRIAQNRRDVLIVDILNRLELKKKETFSQILCLISQLYR